MENIKLYNIYNTQDNEQYFRFLENLEEVKHWIINHLDLSKDWQVFECPLNMGMFYNLPIYSGLYNEKYIYISNENNYYMPNEICDNLREIIENEFDIPTSGILYDIGYNL